MNVEQIFQKANFVHEYRKEIEEFYRPYFPDDEAMEAFFVSIFLNEDEERKPRQMMNQIQRLVRANNDVGSHFLFWALKNMQPWFMNMGIGSTNQQELYRSTIKNAKILVPDEASNLTERFDSYVDPIHKQICILRDKTQNLIIQRDLLLPRLMSGKLEV